MLAARQFQMFFLFMEIMCLSVCLTKVCPLPTFVVLQQYQVEMRQWQSPRPLTCPSPSTQASALDVMIHIVR